MSYIQIDPEGTIQSVNITDHNFCDKWYCIQFDYLYKRKV